MNPSPVAGLHLLAATHAALTVASALLSPHIPGGPNLSIAVWMIGGLTIFLAVAWRSARAWHADDPTRRYIASGLLALGVTGFSLLVSLALMVEAWEWQGYGH